MGYVAMVTIHLAIRGYFPISCFRRPERTHCVTLLLGNVLLAHFIS